ncbi:MAG: glycoside hydrolase family 76 protein, partial [Eubacteriales bacterium]
MKKHNHHRTVALILSVSLSLTAWNLTSCQKQEDPLASASQTTIQEQTLPMLELNEIGRRDLERAKLLTDQILTDYYHTDTKIAEETYPVSTSEYASIWDYMTLLSLVNRLLVLEPGNQNYTEIRDSLLKGLDYYGMRRTDSYKQTVYASRRVNRTWSSTADTTYDDQIWLVREFLNVYDSTGETEWLEKARKLAAFCWDEGWDKDIGGLYWSLNGTTRNTCSNAPFIKELVRLWKYTQDDSYLEKAKQIYDWVNQYLLDTDDNLYWDHVGTEYDESGKAVGTHPPNTDKYSYNTGSMISAGVALYEATGNQRYLKNALRSAKSAFEAFTTEDQKIVSGETYYDIPVSSTLWFHLTLYIGFRDLGVSKP